jgi:subtilisin family serine protease
MLGLSIPSPLVEFILLGPVDDRRQLQDSPVLGDVWIKFAKEPAARLDLLISPSMTKHAGAVADAIDKALAQDKADTPADIAYLQGLIAARLTFEEVLRVVVPKTRWWIGKWTKDPLPKVPERKGTGKARAQQAVQQPEFQHEVTRRYGAQQPATVLTEKLTKLLQAAKDWNAPAPTPRRASDLVPLDRFAALAGLILWAGSQTESPHENQPAKDLIKDILDRAEQQVGDIAVKLLHIADQMLDDESWKKKTEKGSVQVPLQKAEPLVFQVSLNRDALPALRQSVPAVKADAAKTLFKVNCSEIGWAVLDSGIDGNHPAFRTTVGDASRVKRSFDFRNFRKIVSLSNSKDKTRKENLEILMKDKDFLLQVSENPDGDLLTLAKDCRNRAPLHWELIERFVEIKPGSPPPTNHGTHVAGIIGANKKPALESAGLNDDNSAEVESIGFADGMCPDISLYDFRVLGPDLKETEFAIIAALQFIRYLNERDNFFTIHGANLSLSIPHDVRNFACGRTPICIECERVVDSGVVVVAAAGNHGHKSFQTGEGAFETYAAFSITDPGNADGVITVGATHRNWPHTFGVSFFSSRGPTGDGRLKPDLVAPGERIRAPFPGGYNRGGEWGDLDGTSMAAPHVGGAAAMLLARYSELIGQPRRVKRILCDTATDLGRERSFQGHGMLDVLRAFQSI